MGHVSTGNVRRLGHTQVRGVSFGSQAGITGRGAPFLQVILGREPPSQRWDKPVSGVPGPPAPNYPLPKSASPGTADSARLSQPAAHPPLGVRLRRV